MKSLATFAMVLVAMGVAAAPPASLQTTRTNAILPAANYDAAEVVFRSFLMAGRRSPEITNIVFFVSYGAHDSDLPSDFLARFYRQLPLVTNASAATIKTNFTIIHLPTGREGVGLALRELRLAGNKGEAKLVYVASGGSFVHYGISLKREDGRWLVASKKTEMITDP